MSDIDHIVEQGHQVVLVDCMVWFEGKGQYEHEYRWWQVPDNALNKFQSKEED
jgi:hypothetical protein